ncbi:hypothetical protein HELRODRAFT_88819, partial [Helobdella robusta]|uniref:EGF-like domain-containing protein n=1 Tax=Helobdella robusta TaxID=6412 RepID=T1G768_HELRO
FLKGLLSTSKSNFGGGNTKWEETNLGSYAFSETRFLEIIEDICSGQSQQCHQMLEKYEDVLENWWKNVFAKGTKSDLRDFFCIRRTKVCCPHGTYGPDCRDCKPDRKNPCNGNGICDGDGTHSGTGKCSCHPGYEGELCGKCSDGYYARKQRNVAADGDAAANNACSQCGGPDVESCTACASRYFKNNKGICNLDECTMPGFRLRCALDEYCVNSIGSYKCSTCHPTCLSCHGPGRDNCKQCKDGYHIEEGACVDTDECLKSSEVCPGTSRKCINLPGSYRCECVVGFKDHGGVCVPKSQSRNVLVVVVVVVAGGGV